MIKIISLSAGYQWGNNYLPVWYQFSGDFKTKSLVYRGDIPWNHYLPWWYQLQFLSILGQDFNHEIIQWNQWMESLACQVDINWEIITYVPMVSTWWGFQSYYQLAILKPNHLFIRWINGEIITYLCGINSVGISTMKSAHNFETKSLICQEDIHLPWG